MLDYSVDHEGQENACTCTDTCTHVECAHWCDCHDRGISMRVFVCLCHDDMIPAGPCCLLTLCQNLVTTSLPRQASKLEGTCWYTCCVAKVCVLCRSAGKSTRGFFIFIKRAPPCSCAAWHESMGGRFSASSAWPTVRGGRVAYSMGGGAYLSRYIGPCCCARCRR